METALHEVVQRPLYRKRWVVPANNWRRRSVPGGHAGLASRRRATKARSKTRASCPTQPSTMSGYCSTQSLGELCLRGKAEPIQAWDVTAVQETRTWPIAPHFMIRSANLEKIAEVRIFRASHAAEQGDERHCQDGVTSHIEGPSVSRAICRHGSCGESHEATAHAPG